MKTPKASDYNYKIINIGDEEADAFKAIIPKFPGVIAYGDNPKELNDGVIFALEDQIADLTKAGLPIPPPDKKSNNFSGKILIRTSPELHQQLTHEAQAHQMSLNKYIEKKLS